MQVSVESTSELSRKLTVHVPEEKIQELVDKKLKSLAGKVKIDGFRPGKVPHSVIKTRFGAGVREDVLSEMIQSSFYDAVREENLKPAAAPRITPDFSDRDQGLKYVAEFEVMPEFVLYPIEEMEVDRFVSEVADTDLDEMIERLRDQRKSWLDSVQPAELQDRVTLHFEGKSEGEDFTNGKVENFPIELGSNQLIPGFEEQLVGLVPGDKKSFTLTFPGEYGVEKLAGKAADFDVEIIKVEKKQLPEINDEFIANFGYENSDIESFRAEIKASMEREMRRALASRSKDSVMNELRNRNSTLTLPDTLVEAELVSLVNSFKAESENRKIPFDETAARAHYKAIAERRVALGLLLNRIIELNQIKVDQKRVRAAIDDLSLSYEDPQEVINWYYSNKDQLNQVQNMVVEDQVVDLILEKAKVTEQKISFKDLLMQPQAGARA